MVDFRKEPRHCRLPCSRISGKHEVQADGRHLKPHSLPDLPDPYQVDEGDDIVLDFVQSDQAVQLVKELVQRLFNDL